MQSYRNRFAHTSNCVIRSLFILFMVLIPGTVAAQQSLVLGTPGHPPYHYPDQTGILDLWLKEAFSRIGIDATLKWQPPERSLLNANEGITDGDAVRIGGLSSDYPNLIQVPEIIMTSDFVAFTKDVTFRPSGWESLKPYNVAIIRGHKISELNVTGTLSLIKVKDTSLLFGLLNSGRAEVAVCERLFGTFEAAKVSPAIKALDPPLARLDFYLYLHKRHEALAPSIAEALREIKKDGTYERIMRKGMGPGR